MQIADKRIAVLILEKITLCPCGDCFEQVTLVVIDGGDDRQDGWIFFGHFANEIDARSIGKAEIDQCDVTASVSGGLSERLRADPFKGGPPGGGLRYVDAVERLGQHPDQPGARIGLIFDYETQAFRKVLGG